VALIEPVEIELKKKQEIIDIQKEREARKTLLPERKEKLKEYWVEIADEELLDMDSTNFQDFFNQKRAEYLEEKERKLKEDQEKLDAEKKAKELEEQRQKELKETEERARIETEARLKREQEEKERKAKEEEEAKIQAEKAEQEKLEKETKYKKFLSSHEWQFDKIIKEDWKVILYKKVAEFII